MPEGNWEPAWPFISIDLIKNPHVPYVDKINKREWAREPDRRRDRVVSTVSVIDPVCNALLHPVLSVCRVCTSIPLWCCILSYVPLLFLCVAVYFRLFFRVNTCVSPPPIDPYRTKPPPPVYDRYIAPVSNNHQMVQHRSSWTVSQFLLRKKEKKWTVCHRNVVKGNSKSHFNFCTNSAVIWLRDV